MSPYRNLPKTPINKLALWNSSSQEPTPVPELTPHQIEKEQIVKFILKVFDHFLARNQMNKGSAFEKRLASDLVEQIYPVISQHSTNALFTLDLLLSNFKHYCRKRRERTLLDSSLEKLLNLISKNEECKIYRDKVLVINSLIKDRSNAVYPPYVG